MKTGVFSKMRVKPWKDGKMEMVSGGNTTSERPRNELWEDVVKYWPIVGRGNTTNGACRVCPFMGVVNGRNYGESFMW